MLWKNLFWKIVNNFEFNYSKIRYVRNLLDLKQEFLYLLRATFISGEFLE